MAKKHPPMSADELREIIDQLGLTQAEMAAELDVSQRALEYWLSGQRTCRGPAAVLARLMSSARAAISADVKSALKDHLERIE